MAAATNGRRSETPTLPIAPFRFRVAWGGLSQGVCPKAGP